MDEALRIGGLEGSSLLTGVSSNRAIHSHLMDLKARHTVDDLLQLVTDDEMADVCAVTEGLRSHSEPLVARATRGVVANPTFSTSSRVGGADADLILGGCLIDIKAAARRRLTGQHVLQLAGYKLLDVDDAYRFDELGVHLARYGSLLSVPAGLLLDALAGKVPPSAPLDGVTHNVRSLAGWRQIFGAVLDDRLPE